MPSNELMHYGVPGMKWGRRKNIQSISGKRSGRISKKSTSIGPDQAAAKEARKARVKKAAIIGAAVVGTALTVYGARKVSNLLKDKAAAKSYETGKKVAEKYFKEMNDSLDAGNLAKNHSDWKAYRQTLKNTDKRTERVRRSTAEAIKYLRHPERYQVDGRLIEYW